MRLEDKSDIAFSGGFVVDANFVQIDGTCFGCVQTGDTPKRRRFSGTRLTEQHKELFVSDIEIDIVECDEVAEPFCNVFQSYCCHG